ncbi:hypothetical protein IEQ34_019996 [Dendrobium chrysotoxum]|uniref:RIN4 pathogenic type III effector avirulence factor Avr cleavage site domain-containing protein n=1 Tax=Dendrobium chrysotoxum TaxID=161865 RepID=A0AAV7G8U4_DENCH|nr:hypothetical protein IEQ34_019996 [Dendrobium chrysotoxum]
MEVRKEGNERLSVPAFGEWDGKVGLPDYSIDFSRIREHRRQNKSRVSLGNEDELLNRTSINGDQSVESLKKNLPLHQQHGNSTVEEKHKIFQLLSMFGGLKFWFVLHMLLQVEQMVAKQRKGSLGILDLKLLGLELAFLLQRNAGMKMFFGVNLFDVMFGLSVSLFITYF